MLAIKATGGDMIGNGGGGVYYINDNNKLNPGGIDTIQHTTGETGQLDQLPTSSQLPPTNDNSNPATVPEINMKWVIIGLIILGALFFFENK
jgi:hypothetical protein